MSELNANGSILCPWMIPLVIDADASPSEIRFVDASGNTIGKIFNLAIPEAQ